VVHADVPGRGGGVVGGEGLDGEHDLDLVTRVQGGEGDEGGVHAPCGGGGWFGGIEGEGAHEGAQGLADEAWVEGSGVFEDGVRVVGGIGWWCGGDGFGGHAVSGYVRVLFLVVAGGGVVGAMAQGVG
jgi:hypothetical protein